MSQISEFFEKAPERVNKEKIQGLNATYLFNITGENGGQWWVKFNEGEVSSGQGIAENASITLTIEDKDFEDLITGKLNGQTAFLTGKLKIQGDMTLALKLQSIFNLG